MIIRHRRKVSGTTLTTETTAPQPLKTPPIMVMPARVISSQRAWMSPFITVKLRGT